MSKSFPPGHPLRKIFNRNTVKISYSGAPSIGKIISSTNKKILAPPKPYERMCSCPSTKSCPLEEKCLLDNIVYECSVTQNNQKVNKYTGLCSTNFKARLAVHNQTFRDETVSKTSLSRFIWDLKRKNIKYSLSWRILDRGTPFSPVTGKCNLCTKEKFHIMFRPEGADINCRQEIFSACSHKKSRLLIPIERGRKKKSPG